MIKYLYKTIVLLVVFAASLFFFGRQLESDSFDTGTNVNMGNESLPYLTVYSQGLEMNRLYGYSGPIDNKIVRESITPLDTDKKITVDLSQGEARLLKLEYEVIDKETDEVYYSNSVNSIDKNTKQLEITIDYGLKTSAEYILALTGTTDSGRRVHYFTRLKYYSVDSKLKEKMQFAMQFHEDTFKKVKAEELSKYLEPDGTAADNTLATVNIKSNSDLVTWGKLSPKKISQVVPTIKEYNMETACFQLNYYVKGTTASGEEIFHVNEFYRVRFAAGQSYLLNFERSMEAEFDSKYTSVKKNTIKVGITNDTDMDLLENDNKKQLFFARQGNLFCYDMDKKKNSITKIYSAYSEKASYEYKEGGEQNIRLLKTDEEGNLYFAVYGYFPRGQYEGKVAIVLYKYSAGDGGIEELVYLPIDTTYQQLKQDFNGYGYVSERNVYYFTVSNVVYSYNMEARRLTKIAENITDKGFKVIKNSHCFVWSDSLENGYGDNLTVFNLETEQKKVISKKSDDEYIRLLGVINENIIYGYAKKSDVTSQATGEQIVPCYDLMIADEQGKVLKTYSQKNKYITDVSVEGNVMTLTRMRRVGTKRLKAISNDSILNQTEQKSSAYSLQSQITSASQTEWFIHFPSNFSIDVVPNYSVREDNMITSGRSVHLDELKVPKYYVYALGKITGSYENPVEAIIKADEQMGVVVSGSHMVVWERSGSFLMNSIAGLEMKQADANVSNFAACAYMVLKANHFALDAGKLSKKSRSIYQMLSQYMDQTVNLSGATLEQVLYFVSNNKYVIALTGDSTAVVICGYDTKTVSIFNPATGKRETINRTQMEKTFKDAGNRFVSYLNAEVKG